MADTSRFPIVPTEDAPDREALRAEIETLNQLPRELIAQPTVGDQPHWEQITTLVGFYPKRRVA